MENPSWIELLQRVPARYHNILVLMTATAELAIQDLIRMEPEYVVVRGRVSGTTDTGRIFFVPYDRIVYVGLSKPVKEEDVYGMYGEKPPEVRARPAEEEVPTPELEPTEQPADAKPDAETAARHPTPTRGINRLELLERIRARTSHHGTPPGAV
jgi:hypothetical protein